MSEISIATVLEHYGATMPYIRGGGWRPMRCPFADNHKRGDRVLSASVSLGKNAFVCHACGVRGDAIGIVKSQEGLGYQDALKFIQEVLGESVGDLRRSAPRAAAKQRSKWRDKLFA